MNSIATRIKVAVSRSKAQVDRRVERVRRFWAGVGNHTRDHWLARRRQWKSHVSTFRRRIFRWRIELFGSKKARTILFNGAATTFAVLLGISVLSISSLRTTLNDFQPLETILTAIGATYGTMLVLVLTLSLIPIQRAGEAWSTSIVRLYREDRFTQFTFVSLAILCVASFALAVRGLGGVSVSVIFATALLLLGASLDVLRHYHAHICKLLDPSYGVNLAVQRAKKVIEHTNTLVRHIANHQYQSFSPDQKEKFAVEDVEAAIYPNAPGYPQSINSRIGDLAEIAIKAVSRGEKILARTAIIGIVELTRCYLAARKHNLTIRAAPEALFLAVTSDVSVVTDQVYENLREISRTAISRNDETTAIGVGEAHRSIAVHVANLHARAFNEHSSPLSFPAIHSLLQCVKQAQARNLNEFPFQTGALLAEIAIASPKDISQTDIHIPVSDGLSEIATYFYAKREFGLAEEVNGRQFQILAHMLDKNDYYFEEALRHVLEKMELLAPLAIANESFSGRFTLTHPLGKAYGLVSENSVGYLFAKAAETLPKVDNERDWTNPLKDLASILEIIAEHLRNQGERNEFGGSFMLWDINQLIKQLAKVVDWRIAHPLRSGHNDEQVLVDELRALLSFYWVAHRKKKSIHARWADECCDSLAFIGITFFVRDEFDLVETCASNIHSILESYCETESPRDPYIVGDVSAHLWELRLLCARRENARLLAFIDRLLESKPEALTDAQWAEFQHAIILRRNQLEGRLRRHDRGLGRDRAEDLLRRILSEEQNR